MKVVIDCNVLISAGLTDGVCRTILFKILSKHTLYLSKEILAEYKAVITRLKFKNAFSYLYSLTELICELAEWVEAKSFDFILPDPYDLAYLNTALTCEANYLITGNIKDFPEEKYKDVKIITPKNFLLFIQPLSAET